MFRRNKELQSLVDASRKNLKKAEKEVKELTKENKALYEENKDLRFEIDELKDILKEIFNLSRTQQYGSVKNLQNKLKELVRPLNQN